MTSSLERLETLELGGGGNTISPPTQTTQHLHHTFTWNNYESSAIETIINLFSHIAYDFVFQEEKGDSGTPHLQGVVSLKKRMRWSEFGLPKAIHWEKVQVLNACYVYCSDPVKRFGRCFSLHWKIPPKLKILHIGDCYQWQLDILKLIGEEPDDRSILWVWSDKGGVGKSTFCKYLAYHHRAIICGKGNYSDIINIAFNADLSEQSLVVFDLPRNNGNKISYSAIEAIKNGVVCNTKYETGSKIFNAPHILVFSNSEPEYKSMSEDRWRVVCID